MQGYNPSASLLPAGGGAIQPMSGGGMGGAPPMPDYNYTKSLLPATGGEVAPYRGGFFAEDIRLIGGEDTVSNMDIAPPIAPPTAPPMPPMSPTKIVEEQPKTKAITLFGQSLVLEDPKSIKGAEFTETQKKALALFGLDGPGLSSLKKKDVLVSLYDGQCNSDKPLIFQVNCEPMRQIVQSLALNLLNKIKEHETTGTENDAGNPKVVAEKLQDGNFRVYIDFTPAQLPLLSKYNVDEFVQSKRTNRPKKTPPTSASSTTTTTTATAPSVPPAPSVPTTSAPPTTQPSATEEQSMMEIKPQDIIKGGADVITTLGIKNPQFWCYAIAAIQFMFSVPQIREVFSKLDCSKSLYIPTKNDDIDKLKDITPDDTLCALKWVFGELSQNTTKFTESDYAEKITGNKTIPNNMPVLYIMKKFLLQQMKNNKNATGDISIQQDVYEFLRIMFNMIENDDTIKNVLDIFGFKLFKTYKCEDGTSKPPSEEDPERYLGLHVEDYIKDTSIELQNKKKKDNGGISLQNLIDYYSRYQKISTSSTDTSQDMIEGCGPDGAPGVGTYSQQINLDDTNEFIIINPIKSTDPSKPSYQDTSIKIKAEALITIANQKYTIFGATLYSGTGTGGHYTYQRFYADGTDVGADTNINTLPYIMYNTGTTTANNAQGYTILDNATLIIYKRVKGGETATATDIPPVGTESAEVRAPNLKCQAIIRNWLDTYVADKKVITADERQYILRKGVSIEELDACIEYFKKEGEEIGEGNTEIPVALTEQSREPVAEEQEQEAPPESEPEPAIAAPTTEGNAEIGATAEPVATAANNQRGQGAPNINKTTRNELTATRKKSLNKALLDEALRKKPQNRTPNNIERIAKSEQKRAAANLVEKGLSKIKEERRKTIREVISRGEAAKEKAENAIRKIESKNISKLTNKNRSEIAAAKEKLTKLNESLIRKRKELNSLDNKTTEPTKQEMENEFKKLQQTAATQGGGKRCKTATKSKAKTKTFKKKPKKLASKTFKRRK